MGLSSSSLSVLTLDLSDQSNTGRNSSAAQMAGTMSIATALAVSGTLLALNSSNPQPWVFGAIITAGSATALLGLLTAGRVRRQLPAN
jgi:NhaP-type Na+/H+ or K+/H+ antiporter